MLRKDTSASCLAGRLNSTFFSSFHSLFYEKRGLEIIDESKETKEIASNMRSKGCIQHVIIFSMSVQH